MKRGKHVKRILALVLGLAMLSTLASGCVPTGESGGKRNSPAANTGSNISYTIAANDFGADVYPFDTNAAYEQNMANVLGVILNVANNEFTADESVTQLRNQLASAPDRVASLDISKTPFPVAARHCKNVETPYMFSACASKNEDVATFEQDEYHAGTVVYGPQGKGAGIAELALADGCRTAVISAGVSGDYAHDRRIIGFTEALETDGGEALFVFHSADPSEGVQKTDDLLTVYSDVDRVCVCDNGYVAPAVDVVRFRGFEGCKIYGADVGPNICQLIMDGEIGACSGGTFTSCEVTITLLANCLNGNVIKDSEGKAPYFDSLELFTVTSDNAEDFYKFLSDEALSTHTIPDEEYQSLLVRSDTEVNYDRYVDFMVNHAGNVYARVETNTSRT